MQFQHKLLQICDIFHSAAVRSTRRAFYFIGRTFLWNKKPQVRLPEVQQGWKESNPPLEFWRLLFYRWTTPLYGKYLQNFIQIFPNCRRKFDSLDSSFAFARFHQVPSNDHRTNLMLRFRSHSLSALGQAFDRLVTVSYVHCCTSTPALSTSYSTRDLISFMEGISHLEGGFTLRCLQRLSRPDLATLLCLW